MRVERVLVTGASGFVGGALSLALVRAGRHVTAAARSEITLPDASVADAIRSDALRRIRVGDLGADTDWSDALADCSAVVHCAARVHVMSERAADPTAAFRVANVDGSVRLAEMAINAGVRRFIFLSSVKVHGEFTLPGFPFTERDVPVPSDPYGVSKADAEARLREVCGAGGLELAIIRPPLVYGPGVKANFLSMTRWLSRGVPLPFGSVTQNRRSLVALDNLLDLISTCLSHPAAACQTFLAGDGNDLSTTELLRRTAAALGLRARLIPVPAALLARGARLVGRPDLWQRLGGTLQVSIDHARVQLGWQPPLTVDEGLRRAVAARPSARTTP